jgi:hypothetical protein
VLRVREGSFYRIELPATTEEEKEKVDDFKIVLKSILYYERNPSPFSHGYVELPERPHTPIRRTPSQHQPAKKWRLNKVWEPEDAAERAKWSPATPPRALSSLRKKALSIEDTAAPADSEGSAHGDESTEDEDTITEGSNQSEEEESVPPPLDAVDSPKPIRAPFQTRPAHARSITAPPPLTLHTSSPPSSTPLSRTTSRDTDTISIASSHDTFYSLEDSPSPSIKAQSFHSLDPTEETMREQFAAIKVSSHKRQTSELTIIPDTPTPIRTTREDDALQENIPPSDPETPTLIHDASDSDSIDEPPWSDAITPPPTASIRLRHLSRHHSSEQRGLEKPVNLFSSPAAPTRAKDLTTALVQKAYALLIGPPAHLVQLMLEIAAKIVKGFPVMYGPTGRRKRLPGSWEDSSAEEEDEWDEDDFGIPLDSLRRFSASSTGGNSSGVD